MQDSSLKIKASIQTRQTRYRFALKGIGMKVTEAPKEPVILTPRKH